MLTLNEAYSSLSVRRRYEVWFLRMGLADGSGAWWFRYLLMNPGRGGCGMDSSRSPVQVWATWFPTSGKPRTFIQGFSRASLGISRRGCSPFFLRTGDCEIEEDSCRGTLNVDGHNIEWNLRYHSTFRVTLSDKGWIGFSRTPHSDAVFSGDITLDGRKFSGDPLGYGLQGHNCGYRHRDFWAWMHAFFPGNGGPPTTLEALVYNMPFGLVFRKSVLLHEGKSYIFRNVNDSGVNRESMQWNFRTEGSGLRVSAAINGNGPSLHRLPYTKTNCSGTFEVMNNSLASANVVVERANGAEERLETTTGAVLELGGDYSFR